MDLLAPGCKYNGMASLRAEKVKGKLLITSDFWARTIVSGSREKLLSLRQPAN